MTQGDNLISVDDEWNYNPWKQTEFLLFIISKIIVISLRLFGRPKFFELPWNWGWALNTTIAQATPTYQSCWLTYSQ